jgi:hypothetical protein
MDTNNKEKAEMTTDHRLRDSQCFDRFKRHERSPRLSLGEDVTFL